jgi:hypothetical protein
MLAMAWNRSSTTNPGNRTFTLFPELPVDLRLQIWETTFEPRVLEIEDKIYRQHELPKPPITLSICTESRCLAKTHYPISFNNKFRFNFKLDTLFINPRFANPEGCFLPFFSEFELPKLRYLAIQHHPYVSTSYDGRDHTNCIESLIKALPNLLHLIIVHEVFDLTGDPHPFLDRETEDDIQATIQLHAEFTPRRYRKYRPWPRFLSKLPDVTKTHGDWIDLTRAKVYPLYGYREFEQAWTAAPKHRSFLAVEDD